MTRPENPNIPVWLRGVPLPESPASAAPQSAPSDTGATGLPNWLRDLSSGEEAAPAVGIPAAEEPPQAEESSTEDEGDLPDWLRSLGEVSASTPAIPVPEPEAPSTPAPRTPGFTSWLTGEPSAPAAPAAPAQQENLPAWLRGGAQEQQPSEEPEQLPDWLQSLEPKLGTTPADPTVAAPPSWMQGDQSTTSAEEVVPSHPAQQPVEADSDVPAWLRATPDAFVLPESDDLGADIAPFSLGDTPPAGSASEWLGANASQLLSAGSPVAPSNPTDSQENDFADLGDDIPSWLREAAGPIPEDPPISTRGSPADVEDAQFRIEPDDADDVPAWLRDVSSSAAGPAAPTPPEEAPAWLNSSNNTSAAPTAAEPTEDIPAWLRSSAPAAPNPPEDVPAWLSSSVPATPTAPEEVPDWLRESPAEVPAAPEADVPAWLRSEPASADVSPGEPQAVDNDLPAWMRESNIPAAPDPPELTPASVGDLPDWLQNTASLPNTAEHDALPPWLRDEGGEPLPTTMPPGEAALPVWLRGSDMDIAEPAPAPAQRPGAAPQADSTQTSSVSDSDLLGGADLPAWLRRDTEKPRETNAADARSLDWLAQLGGVDDDVAPAAVETGPRLRLPSAPVRTAAQIEALTLLRTMAANPLPVAPAPEAAAAPSALNRIGLDRFLAIVLLVALLVGLATPGLANGLTSPAPTPVVQAFHDQISSFGPNDVVLIGYEWDAQRVSEMRALERAVIGQLIAQKVKVVLVSTDPQGSLLQFDLRDQLVAKGYAGYGVDYLLLGYRAGGEIGLRQLAQNMPGALRSDFQGNDVSNVPLTVDSATGAGRLDTLNGFAMLLVLADEPTDVQGWIEQIRPATTRPIGFLVPASVGPFAQPYFHLPGVLSLVGMTDALAYEQLRGPNAASETTLKASQLQLSSLIFAGLLAIGTLGMLIHKLVQRRRRNP